jgi:hypothetical protein
LNVSATTTPRRRPSNLLVLLRALATRGGFSRASHREAVLRQPDREVSAPQRERMRARLPFDGSDCD